MASLVHIVYNSNSIMKCITVEGHAGIKKSGEGYEVCIALSVLTQAMYKALLSTIGKKFLEYKTDDGLLSLELINYLIGIKSLIKEYPDFIKYKEEYKNGT